MTTSISNSENQEESLSLLDSSSVLSFTALGSDYTSSLGTVDDDLDKLTNVHEDDKTLLINRDLLLHNTNQMLSSIGINAKKIMSIDELQRVASSMFVAIYESLFHERVAGINRHPNAIEDYEENAQMIIDRVGSRIHMDLQHITGTAITSGDLMAILNLINIFTRIANITSKIELEVPGGEKKLPATKDRNQLEREDIEPRLNFSLSFQNVAQVIRSNENKIRQMEKLEAAKRRRDQQYQLKLSSYSATNNIKVKKTCTIKEKRSMEDYIRHGKSISIREMNKEYVLLRQVIRINSIKKYTQVWN